MRRLSMLVATALLLLVAPAVDATPRGGTYLALGDSVAAGTQAPAPFTDDGYVDRLGDHLERHRGFDEVVNLACPGDDTVEMVTGVGSACYGAGAVLPPGGTSQLDVAVAHLSANPGEVRLITLVIGANDLLACDPQTLTPPQLSACVAAQLGQIAANLPVIIDALHAVAPDVPIVAMNYYNPNLAYWVTGPAGRALAADSLLLTRAFNDTLAALYGAFGVPVVDVASAFDTWATKGGATPKNVRSVCRFTQMCEKSGRGYVLSDQRPDLPGVQPDIHPSDTGHARIARAHVRLIHRLDVLG